MANLLPGSNASRLAGHLNLKPEQSTDVTLYPATDTQPAVAEVRYVLTDDQLRRLADAGVPLHNPDGPTFTTTSRSWWNRVKFW